MKPRITNEGLAAKIRALDGEGITFTKIKMGNGSVPDDYMTLTDLVNAVATVGLELMTEEESGYVELTGSFSNNSLSAGFNWTEVGIFIQDPEDEDNDLLYAYGHVDLESELETSTTIPKGSTELYELELTYRVYVGEVENLSAILADSSVYATKAELQAHIEDNQNPHHVTKAQVGLGNVENVSVNDMAPAITEAQNLANLAAGDVFSTIISKVAKAISTLINHLGDNISHISSAERTSWNNKANGTHTHSASDINAGTLGLARGGTGATSASAAAKNILANGAKEIGGRLIFKAGFSRGIGGTTSNSGYIDAWGVINEGEGNDWRGNYYPSALAIMTADEGNEPIIVRQCDSAVNSSDLDEMFRSIKRALYLLDVEGNTSLPGDLHFQELGSAERRGVYGHIDSAHDWRVVGIKASNSLKAVEIAVAGNSLEPVYVRQYSPQTGQPGKFWNIEKQATLLDRSGNTVFPGSCTATSHPTSSDRKAKEDITGIRTEDASELIMGLNPVSFKLKDDGKHRGKMGFIAQDIFNLARSLNLADSGLYQADVAEEDGETVLPDDEIVKYDDSQLRWTVDYQQLIAPMVKVIQDQERRIRELEERLNAQEV